MYKAHVFHTTIIDFDQSQKYENKQNMIHLLKTNIHKQVMLWHDQNWLHRHWYMDVKF